MTSADRSLVRRSWSALRGALVRHGLSAPLLRLGLLGLSETRRHLALRYLPAGAGLEIGALHAPLPLPAGARVLYIDKHAPDVLKERRADAGEEIVRPDILADGLRLHCIVRASQDFVIANHVLEHATDALDTLRNWLRVLRPGGVLFVAVPRGERCFDRGRAVTPASHFMEDYLLGAMGVQAAMRERNRAHVEEFLSISQPAIARLQGQAWVAPGPEERRRLVDRLLDRDPEQVHHHVFSQESFGSLLGLLDELPGSVVRVERIAQSRVEIVGVVRKLS